MAKPMIRIHNAETGEIVDREMNEAEYAEYQTQKAIQDAKIAEAEIKAADKAALLDRLGITADEAALLLG